MDEQRMQNRLREALDGVHADGMLKRKTRDAVTARMARRGRPMRRLLPVLACLLPLLIGGGYWLWQTPVLAISIDINPSIELTVNRFNRVLDVEGYNEAGAQLADTLDVTRMDCIEAVDSILASEPIRRLIEREAVVEITVVGEGGQQEAVLAGLESCTAGQSGIHCHAASAEAVAEAHALGLSYGKYRIYAELRRWDPTLTPEAAGAMTMRELRDRLAELQGEADAGGSESDGAEAADGPGHGEGRGGSGKGQGRRWGMRDSAHGRT